MLDNYITIGVEFSYLANVREVTTCRIFRGEHSIVVVSFVYKCR
nr:MAG TPA: hypothetical protein [Inoviridae sp.]